MKNYLFLLLTLVLISCEDDEVQSIGERIQGEWFWLQSVGGIDGRTETPASTQTEISIVITSNSLKKYKNGSLESERSFLISRGSSIYSEGEKDILIFDDDMKQAVEVNGNRLFLRDECHDCFQHEYIK